MQLILNHEDVNNWVQLVEAIDSDELRTVHNNIFGPTNKFRRPKGVSTTVDSKNDVVILTLDKKTANTLFKTLKKYGPMFGDGSKSITSLGKLLNALKTFGADLAKVFE